MRATSIEEVRCGPDHPERARRPLGDPQPVPAPDLRSTPPSDAALDRHRAAVWRWLRLAGCDGAAADDVCQEVFLVAVDRLSDWSSAGAVRQWLLAAARNKLLHHRRAFARCGLVVDVEAADQIYADRWSDESDGPVRALRHCLGELTPRAREAIEARVTDRVGRADLARRLGMKVGGVKTLLGRTRAALRACIERRMAGEESNDA